jgi:hypothetical protein
LWADLQNLPVFFQPYTRTEFHGVPQIVWLNIPAPSKLIETAAVDTGNRTAEPDDRRFRRRLRPRFGFVQSKSDTLRECTLVA